MHQTTHEGVQLRSQRSIPEWGPDLIVRYFRQTGAGPSANLFADVIAVDNLFPEEWSKLQRRERLTRLVDTNLEIDGRYVVRIENKPKRTKSMYEKTKTLVVEPGQLVVPSRTGALNTFVPASSAPAWPAPPAPAPSGGEFVTRADFQAFATSMEAMLQRLTLGSQPVGQAPPHAPSARAPTPVPAAAPAYVPLTTEPMPPVQHMRTSWGAELPRPMMTYRIEELEQNVALIRRLCEMEAVVYGPVGARHSFDDTARRALRAINVMIGTAGALEIAVDDFVPESPVLPRDWLEIAPMCARAGFMINRILKERPHLMPQFAFTRAPELVSPSEARQSIETEEDHGHD